MFWKTKKNDSKINEILDRVIAAVSDEETQNKYANPAKADGTTCAPKCDQIAGAYGEFGRTPTNPIPVNGPLGEVTYLSLLRRSDGMPFVFHRLGSRHGLDCYEVMSLDRRTREELWFDFYFLGRSRKAPEGYRLESRLEAHNLVYGTNGRLKNFPNDTYEGVRNYQERLFKQVLLPTYTVRAFCLPEFEKVDWAFLNPAYRQHLMRSRTLRT